MTVNINDSNNSPDAIDFDVPECETAEIDLSVIHAAMAAAPAVDVDVDVDVDVNVDADAPEEYDDISVINGTDVADVTDDADDNPKFSEVLPLVESGKWVELRRALSSWPPPDVADLISHRLSGTQRTLTVRFLPRYFAAEVFSELSPSVQDELLTDLTNTEIRNLLADLDPDDRAALMDEMPADMTRKLLNLLSPQDLMQTRELLGYPEGSVGRIMTPSVVYIKEDWTVGEALDHIRTFGHDSETINVVYVTDSTGRLIDDIALSALIMAEPSDEINSLMDYNFFAISATDSQESAVDMIKKYNFFALPVVDSAGVILGIVTVDDLMDVADTQATVDFHKLGAVSVESEDGPIEDLKVAPVSLLYKRRIVWLIVLVFVGIFSGAAIAAFEDTIQAIPMLVFFLTFLIGSGGNTGSQASTLMVRALATGDVKMKDWGKMIYKELRVAAALGGVMAGAAGLLGVFRGGFTGEGFNALMAFNLAAVVAMSMFLIVIVGSLIGMSLPFALKRFGKDPAMASAPLVASVADIVGILIYFSVAAAVFKL